MRIKRFVLWAIAVCMALPVLASVENLYAAPPLRDCGGAQVYISSPAGGESVSGAVPIVGSANLPGSEFRFYKLEFAHAGTNEWVTIVDRVRTPVINGVLATVNANALPPGDYILRLLAVDRSGNYCEGLALVRVGLASDPPTPTSIPYATSVPIASADKTSVPIASAGKATGAAVVLPAVSPGTPTVVVDLPKDVPGSDSIFTQGNGKSPLPFNPSELGSVGDSAGQFAGQLSHQFTFGMQAMAGLFILLGVIAFLRENL